MRIYPDCYPCFLRQALDASRMAGASDEAQYRILRRVLRVVEAITPEQTSPGVSSEVHRIVREITGVDDPYREAKSRSTREALELLPRLEAIVQRADDPLDAAVRLSIAGNIIDFGPGRAFDLWATVERVLTQPFAVDDGAAFRAALTRADWVLYLADNAGETVFDRVLIPRLGKPVVYVVKGGPSINDATVEDAREAGVDKVAAEVITTGVAASGVPLPLTSEAFRRRFDAAPMIVAKGQGNYETLSEMGPRLFFLLQAKCPVIARDLDVPLRSLVLKQGSGT